MARPAPVIILALDAPGSMRWSAGHTGKSHIGAYAVFNMTVEYGLKEYGMIEFGLASERDDLAHLRRLLDRVYKDYKPGIVVVEHPFLHAIAQFVGSVKMWVATKRSLPWYMINPSQAQRLVFGKALHKKRITKTGRVVSDSLWKKQQVHDHVVKRFKMNRRQAGVLSQHEADAIFYALAVAERIREEQ
jgi:Holliday junction resolvasome RuvABC endonuclease subunit